MSLTPNYMAALFGVKPLTDNMVPAPRMTSRTPEQQREAFYAAAVRRAKREEKRAKLQGAYK